MSGRHRRALGDLRTYVAVPSQPYFIAEAAGEEPLTSANILEIIANQTLVSIERTAFDIGQVLMRDSYEKSIASARNLVKEMKGRYVRRAQLAFMLPESAPLSRSGDEEPWDDEVLKLVVAILQDTKDDISGSKLVEETSRHSMSPLAHGEYILVFFDALTDDFVSELVGLFASLLDRHDADDGIRPILNEVVLQQRAALRGFLRRYGVWV